MHGKLTQPKIDGYISWLRRNDHFGMTSCIYDDKSQKLLDELFELLEANPQPMIKRIRKDGTNAGENSNGEL